MRGVSKNLTKKEIGTLIENWLNRQSLYPGEWNDFIDGKQKSYITDAYRAICYELDPLINPEDPLDGGTAELVLRSLAKILQEDRSTKEAV